MLSVSKEGNMSRDENLGVNLVILAVEIYLINQLFTYYPTDQLGMVMLTALIVWTVSFFYSEESLKEVR